MNTSALTHTGVHSSIHIGVKTGAHRHTLSWSAVASNLFCNISYVCCSITFNFRIYCDLYRCLVCCCSLFDVVSSVVFSFCQQVSKQIVFFFFFVFLFFFGFFFWGFFFFFLSLSLSIPHSPFFSLSLPLLCWLSPQPFFYFFLFFLSSFFFLSLVFSVPWSCLSQCG